MAKSAGIPIPQKPGDSLETLVIELLEMLQREKRNAKPSIPGGAAWWHL